MGGKNETRAYGQFSRELRNACEECSGLTLTPPFRTFSPNIPGNNRHGKGQRGDKNNPKNSLDFLLDTNDLNEF